jgi:hypothetical protein
LPGKESRFVRFATKRLFIARAVDRGGGRVILPLANLLFFGYIVALQPGWLCVHPVGP